MPGIPPARLSWRSSEGTAKEEDQRSYESRGWAQGLNGPVDVRAGTRGERRDRPGVLRRRRGRSVASKMRTSRGPREGIAGYGKHSRDDHSQVQEIPRSDA